MKKIAAAATVILLLLLGGAYYYFSAGGYVVRLTEPEIQKKLDEQLPLTKTYLVIIQVTLNNPKIDLVEGSDRIRAGMDVEFNITGYQGSKPLEGTVYASSGITYRAEKGQFYLSDPVIENLEAQGLPEEYMGKAKKALSEALAEYYKDQPIYTLDPDDTRQAVARMVLKDVRVEDKQLLLTLGI
ncbi:hypothetical protein AN478_00140 [Thiohalorhabdus denitrificans]|uniref:DUF1439 domain-containing protein n=1 Tax=Thiohalorhabdus denitrificans TaxID=381306 RepID=A0A0N8PNM5_9GAMM|nr:DUF1439 domain-containing protein [Thiohalorhabdus denitrificans]KPV41941.1 hypothetical protein AN478_00140 [Thiohalorhabdus denitrificans]SCY66069.1 Protein of unknown function [Thiohalorhabdus denitrificans]